MNKGLQLLVEVDRAGLFVVLDEEDSSLQVRHIRSAEEQAHSPEMPPEQLSLRISLVDDLVAGVGHEVAVLLVLIPGVIAPVVGGQDLERLPAHQAPLEVLRRVLDAALHAEGREMGPRVGYEAGPGVDRARERRDVRETAEDFGVVLDKVVVQIVQ